MSQGMQSLTNKLPGYGPLPYPGLSGRVVALSSCSRVDGKSCFQFKNGLVKCAFKGASFFCEASSGGRRRNSNPQKQNTLRFYRNINRQNEEGASIESFDESTLMDSKNGPLMSFSNPSKSQAPAAPGSREDEIVELFRKVQTKLLANSAAPDKKVEARNEKGNENETVESLLQLLKKYSIGQDKKNNSGGLAAAQHERKGSHNEAKTTSSSNSHKQREKHDTPEANDHSFGSDNEARTTSSSNSPKRREKNDRPEPSGHSIGSHNEARTTSSLNSPKIKEKNDRPEPSGHSFGSHNEARTTSSLNSPKQREKNDRPEPNDHSFTRPPSNFRRKSPIPRMKFEPIYSIEDSVDSEPSGENEQQFDMHPESAQLSDLEPEEQPELEFESPLPAEASNTNRDSENQLETEQEDLNSLKVSELKALAKSRGLKGFSKMKKVELVELLSG